MKSSICLLNWSHSDRWDMVKGIVAACMHALMQTACPIACFLELKFQFLA